MTAITKSDVARSKEIDMLDGIKRRLFAPGFTHDDPHRAFTSIEETVIWIDGAVVEMKLAIRTIEWLREAYPIEDI